MKHIIILLLCFGFLSFSNAQTVVKKSETSTSKVNGMEITLYDDKPFDGYIVEHYKNGKPKTWITMQNGLPNGKWQELLDNGNLRFDSYWKDGKAQGLWKYFHDNGKLKYEEAYIMDISNGISRTYYNNGTLQNDLFYLNGKKHGICSYYSESGILTKQEIYKNGNLISTTEDDEKN